MRPHWWAGRSDVPVEPIPGPSGLDTYEALLLRPWRVTRWRPMTDQVTTIIPTWRRAAWLDRCLRAVLRQKLRVAEVVVVGRSEDEEAREVVRRADNGHVVRWVEVDRPGHIAPIQRGLEAACGEFVAFLDDDAEPAADWLLRLVEPFEDLRVGCVGGRVVVAGFRGKVKRDAGCIRWYGEHIGNVGKLEAAGPVEVDAVMEGNSAWRASLLRQLKFDPVLDFEDGSMYGLDLCLQARAAGYRVVYHPAARVVHHVAPRDPSLERSHWARRVFTYSRNYTYIALKHFRGVRRAAFLAWWWLVGDSGSQGVARGLHCWLVRGSAANRAVRASFAGKWEGFRLWLSSAR